MVNLSKLIFALSLLIAWLLSPHAIKAKEFQQRGSISVMGTSSLTEALTELTQQYVRDTGVIINASYGSPSDLKQRINEGETADLFVSEQSDWINDFKQSGLIDVFSITNLIKNQLAIIADSNSHLLISLPENIKLHDIVDYLLERTIIVIADPNADPLGSHTKIALQNLKKWDKVQRMSLKAPNSVNAVHLISKGRSAGVTYYSDAYSNPEVKIIKTLPENLHEDIVYQAAVIAGENMEVARKFLNFLKSDQAMRVFIKHGFTPM